MLAAVGVEFTRNPATTARELYFDFQFYARGEDLVAGRHKLRGNECLHLVLPAIWARLGEIGHEPQALSGDARDLEFTVQSGCCSCCRPGGPNARTGRRGRSPWIWSTKGC